MGLKGTVVGQRRLGKNQPAQERLQDPRVGHRTEEEVEVGG